KVSKLSPRPGAAMPPALRRGESHHHHCGNNMAQKMIKAAALAGFVLAAANAFATPITYTESGDAGDLVTGAVQTVTGAAGSQVGAIKGTLTANSGGIYDGDAYKIYISSPSTFSATTTGFSPGINSFDSELFLFNLDGTRI